ncbi:hypothetical protein GNF10_17350 [Nostoc sp. UCD121]|uniref:hypothetical protein n=1 Tax=unclassified Nostoc TaxID=2593658 RepID=UPI0016273C86|nr:MULTISPECIES: hypothetical protein [unclassified Nostoc]MBC1218487.1 hypothetical protein [Nostoc sp. UCD120]MBC1277675.1 hypothetical protein [Nostoc sp. UCD121]MBC1296205.1 hypothetical protein [Nostoc sp. UCD122]
MINNVSAGNSSNKFTTCTNGEKSLSANDKTEILNANPNRKYSAFINNSSVDITLILGDTAQGGIGKGIILNPRGSYEINANNLYLGKVSAIAASLCKLSLVECI